MKCGGAFVVALPGGLLRRDGALAFVIGEVHFAQAQRLVGVISRSSSSSMYSRDSSREKITGGAILALSSLPEARLLVSFLVRQMFLRSFPK